MQDFQLAPNLDLLAAQPLKDALLAQRGVALRIDAGQVQRLGGQCLQVLLAARVRWRADGLHFEISGPSQAFTEHARLLGATYFLGLDNEGTMA